VLFRSRIPDISLPHGFLRDRDGSFTQIDVPGALATFANGLENGGTVVGTFAVIARAPISCDPAQVVITLHGFVRTALGQYFTIDAPGSTGAVNTVVDRISDAGEIIGSYSIDTLTGAALFAANNSGEEQYSQLRSIE